MRLCQLVIAGVVASGCAVKVEADAGPPTTATLEGEVCFKPVDPTAFQTKLIIVFDMSGASCVIDPPGAQSSPGLCETLPVPPGVTVPARVLALQALLDSLANRPDVKVALVPYETNVKGVWPFFGIGGAFARPDASLRARVSTMQAELGNLGDLEGALRVATSLIESDVVQTEQSNPELLPLTSYQVLLVSNGPPRPRCATNDVSSNWADDTHLDGVWPDTDPTLCNVFDPNNPDAVIGFVAGTSRNQTSDLVAIADDLVAFSQRHRLGRLGFQGILELNGDALSACGAPCLNLFGQKFRRDGTGLTPVTQGVLPTFLEAEASALMTSLADHFHGQVRSFSNAAVRQTTFADTDLSGLASAPVSKQLVVWPARATPVQGAWLADRDGDGLADTAELAAGTNPDVADTDGDGFDDGFEVLRANQFFDPKTRDARGCDPMGPMTLGCSVRDTDGDGLSQFAEAFLGTRVTMVDSDLDGFPDGLEARFGLDPTVGMGGEDSDQDGVSDADELLHGSDPLVVDLSLSRLSVVRGEPFTRADGKVCQPFRATDLPMVDVVAQASGRIASGSSLFEVWSVAEPAKAHSFGEWTKGCVWARRDTSVSPPLLAPADLTVRLDPTDMLLPTEHQGTGKCVDLGVTTP
ncbi:MAG: hypothetical protein U0228_08340 [Myxococcaceae bacterium]